MGYLIGGFDIRGYSCNFPVGAGTVNGVDCAVPSGSNSGTFTVLPQAVTADTTQPLVVSLISIVTLLPGQSAQSVPITVRAQKMTLSVTPASMPEGTPTQLTATVSFLAPPEPNFEDSNFPVAALDPLFLPRFFNAEDTDLSVFSTFGITFPPDFFTIPNVVGTAHLVGSPGTAQFNKQFTITATGRTQIPFEADFFIPGFGPLIADAQVNVTKPPKPLVIEGISVTPGDDDESVLTSDPKAQAAHFPLAGC